MPNVKKIRGLNPEHLGPPRPVVGDIYFLFSTTCFGLREHQQVEHKNKRIYVHSSYGTEISEPHTLCCYVGIRNMGIAALGMGFV